MSTRNHSVRLLSTGAVAAALVAAVALAAPAAAAAEAEITSTPGPGSTYTPVDTPDVITVEVTFDDPVAVSGQPVFRLVVGRQTRNMAYVDGSGTETLTFEYTVQTGDLDTDGISYNADAVRGGQIRDNEDGSRVNRRVAALARDPDHRVDGIAPRPVSVQVASNPAAAGTYAIGQEVVVRIRFDEAVSSTSSSIELDFDGDRRTATRTGLEGDTATFTYIVVEGDVDANGFVVPGGRVTVADEFGNRAERDTDALRTGQRVDGVVPLVERAAIVSSAGGDRTYQAGDRIELEVTFSEPVRGLVGSTFALLVGTDTDAVERSAEFVSGENTSRVRYRYRVQVGDSDTDGISFAADALSGTITDRAGNTLNAAVPAVGEQANHRVDGGEDPDPPRVTGVTVTSTPARRSTYAIGDMIEVTVRFNENVDVTDPEELKLWLEVGSREVQADFVEASDGEARPRFAYTVMVDDFDSTGIAVGRIAEALVGGTIEDMSGNTAIREFRALPNQAAHRVDGIAPVVEQAEIVSRPETGDTYALGNEIEVEVTFSEAVVANGELGLEITMGEGEVTRLAHLVSGQETRKLRFGYRVQQDDYDPDGMAIATTALVGSAADLAGNPAAAAQPGLALGAQSAHKVDARATAPATVSVVSHAGADQTYGRGDLIELTVTFAEDVIVEGTPDLVLSFGSGDNVVPTLRRAQLFRQSRQVLTFRYEVGGGDQDPDGLSVGVNALVGGDIVDAHGNPARLLTALEAQEAHKVDGVEPVPVGTEITSEPGTYGFGAAIDFAVSFEEVVHADDLGDCVLRIVIGGQTREAALFAGSGTPTLRFRYIVEAEDRDDDGISMNANALACGMMTDNAGNEVNAALQGLPAQPRHKVDGRRREARLSIDSPPEGGGAYGDGDPIDLILVFPHTVFVLGGGGLELALSVGGTERRAAFVDGSGTSELRFRYVVQAGDMDDDGISVAAGPDSLLGGRIQDADGNVVARNFPALAADGAHRVDAVRARAEEVRIVSSPGDAGYGLGDTVELVAVFNETVYVTDAAELTLQIGIGAETRSAAYADGSGTDTLVFEYRIAADDRDDDGISVGPDAIVGGLIEDAAGNASEGAERRVPPLPADSQHKVNPDVDRVPPIVAEVAISSEPDDDTYRIDETIAVDVRFDEVVHVSGEPGLEILIGAATRAAGYASGSGTDTLRFRYTVVDGDRDADGISIGPGTHSLTGGTIVDGAGNEARRDFEGLPADPRHTVRARLIRPTVAYVRIASPAGTYREDDPIDVEIEFSEVVHVGGEPELALSIGAFDRAAAYFTGSGTDTLRFRYTVVYGDRDADGISIAANALAGGTIASSAGTAAVLDFAAIPQQAGYTVDAVPTAVEGVLIVSEPVAAGGYDVGEAIEVDVVFDEVVLVTDAPSLALSVGAATRYAEFAGGGGTRILHFAYVVGEGESDDDGISVPANSLAGGTITDVAGNAAVLGFRGLPADPDHRVDAGTGLEPPAVESVDIVSPAAGEWYLLGEDIEIHVWFGREVHVVGQPTLALSVGGATRTAAFASGSGTPTLVFRYVVEAGDFDDDGVSIGADALTGGTITDPVGLPAGRRFAAIPADPSRKVDAVLPAVTGVGLTSDPGDDGTYGRGDTIEAAVEFDDVVHVRARPTLELRIGANSRSAAFASGSGTTTLYFHYEVGADDRDDDGLSIGANTLADGLVEDSSGNPVNRRFAALGPQDGHRVKADGIPPQLAKAPEILPPAEGDTFRIGETIEIRIEFTEAVFVTGQPTLVLSVGTETRSAALVSGSGTTTLVFRYTVQAGDRDDDGLSIAQGALAGGTIEDAAGNAANRNVELPADPRYAVDGTVAMVDAVTVAEPAEGAFLLGDTIEIRVEFTEAVYVTGQPVLALSVGTETRSAALVSGSGTT
ncbi:MAG: hypothetical protein OXQ90_16165, partial [Gammaproteobacteria bacterium]|nr:hypothetical protein [Gammaproteobacteria bacterium]